MPSDVPPLLDAPGSEAQTRAPEVKKIRRKLAELAAAGKAADWVMALARHHAAIRPDAIPVDRSTANSITPARAKG